jgi:hypothetical protein
MNVPTHKTSVLGRASVCCWAGVVRGLSTTLPLVRSYREHLRSVPSEFLHVAAVGATTVLTVICDDDNDVDVVDHVVEGECDDDDDEDEDESDDDDNEGGDEDEGEDKDEGDDEGGGEGHDKVDDEDDTEGAPRLRPALVVLYSSSVAHTIRQGACGTSVIARCPLIGANRGLLLLSSTSKTKSTCARATG